MNIEIALKIALDSHWGQKDKAGRPYIGHPLRVMSKMDTDEERMAALLHDVVEDVIKDKQIAEEILIEAGFSEDVVEAVLILTREDGQDYLEYIRAIRDYDIDWRKRNQTDSPSIPHRVKRADLADNMDLSRLEIVTHKDLMRNEKYLKAERILTGFEE